MKQNRRESDGSVDKRTESSGENLSHVDYRALVENLKEGVYRSTFDGQILLANPALAKILGYDSVADLKRVNVKEMYVDPLDREENINTLIRDRSVSRYCLRLKKKNGETIIVEETGQAVFDAEGQVLYCEGIIQDVTERVAAEIRYRSLVENAGDAIWTLDSEGRFVSVNRAFERILGFARDSLVGKHIVDCDLIAPEYISLVVKEFKQRLQGEPSRAYEIEVLDINGNRIPIEISTQRLQVDAQTVEIVGIGRDMRARKALERELVSTKNHLQSVIDNALDAIIVTDDRGTIQGWNKGAERIFEVKRQAMLGQPIDKIFPEDKYFSYYRARRNLALGNPVSDLELTWVRTDGTQIHLNISVSPIRNEKGSVVGASAIARDTTEKKKLEVTLQHLVITDHLTETFNRYYFDQLLQKEITRSKRHGYALSIALIDIDGFKAINDRHGHQIGDKVLKESARILKSSIRNSDTLVRYGGDEFLILLPETDQNKILYVVRRIEEKLHIWNQDESFLDRPLEFSIGYATCVGGDDVEKSLRSADMQMYEQKNRKRGGRETIM
ncbi:MAG TPA: PAS domain S-box protein [Acidobacteriota bacterium]|jgi:diguanylate cyclase (GGDEF)-like protein/PAS domain S-box-containing protein